MRRKIPTVLEPKEVEAIIDQPNKRVPTGLRNKAILSFTWDSGARVSDIINLRPGNVSLTKREAVIKEGKGGVDRVVSFSDYTAELFKKWKTIRPKSGYFFCTIEGKKLDRVYLYQMVSRYAKRTGVDKKVGFHTLRHSFALNFYKASGHDLVRLQKILGHKSIKTTEIYCYIDSTDVIEGLKEYYLERDKKKNPDIIDRIKELEKEIQTLRENTEKAENIRKVKNNG
jgi:integrase/recombinase XerD